MKIGWTSAVLIALTASALANKNAADTNATNAESSAALASFSASAAIIPDIEIR